jgi:hypothetical protein
MLRDKTKPSLRACGYLAQALAGWESETRCHVSIQNGRASPVRCKLTGH